MIKRAIHTEYGPQLCAYGGLRPARTETVTEGALAPAPILTRNLLADLLPADARRTAIRQDQGDAGNTLDAVDASQPVKGIT